LAAAAAQAGDNDESFATRREVDGESKVKDDKDDINGFFDKFEKTGGKNFRPGWLQGRLCVLIGSLEMYF
jgi:hypothetical protein